MNPFRAFSANEFVLGMPYIVERETVVKDIYDAPTYPPRLRVLPDVNAPPDAGALNRYVREGKGREEWVFLLLLLSGLAGVGLAFVTALAH